MGGLPLFTQVRVLRRGRVDATGILNLARRGAAGSNRVGVVEMTGHEEAIGASDVVEKSSRRPNPIDAHVGSRVRLRRVLLGMSQERLAEQLGLTFQQVQKYEKGINRIGASRLFDLAHVLGVPIQFFYEKAPAAEGAGEPSAGFAEQMTEGYIVDFLNSREGLELNKAFVRITDPKVRRAIVELVRSLASEENAN
jgi:transcriptional regulator with XRE-family HTH domain